MDTNSFSKQEYVLLHKFFKNEWKKLKSDAENLNTTTDTIYGKKDALSNKIEVKKIAEAELTQLRDSMNKLNIQRHKIHGDSQVVNQCIE